MPCLPSNSLLEIVEYHLHTNGLEKNMHFVTITGGNKLFDVSMIKNKAWHRELYPLSWCVCVCVSVPIMGV